MRKFKAGIIGHFGFGHNCLDGQTIKTKIVATTLKTITNDSLYCVDTYGGARAIVHIIIGCFKLLRRCNHIFVSVSPNGLKIIIPILAVINCIYNKKLHYSVIGGWLPLYLKNKLHYTTIGKRLPLCLTNKKWLLLCLKKFHCIYVETNTMKIALEELGLHNCIVIPNTKDLHILSETELKRNTNYPLKLCTFSRVMKEKGIEDIIEVVKNINLQRRKIVYTLDIYGQIDSAQKDWFENLLAIIPEFVNYRGVIEYNKSVEVLKDYYALIFPTHYYTEGVPGTIIDAYAAGLPVISAKWESYSDVIEEGCTGFGYDFGDIKQLQSILERIVDTPAIVIKLKKNCILKAHEFSTERLKNDLITHMGS